jgi:methylglyoxal synthase
MSQSNLKLNTKDHRELLSCLHELVKLRNLLTENWIDPERLVNLLNYNRDGTVSYDEFYDGMCQFGLVDEVDVDKVFSYMDQDQSGSVTRSALLESLRFGDCDDEDGAEKERSIEKDTTTSNEEIPSELFPETLLVALVAHNNMKSSMLKFVKKNLHFFKRVNLVTTGSTGRALSSLGLNVHTLVSSGPLGGDQEIGSLIVKGEVAAVFFFTDPLSAHPHEADIAALNRICCVRDTMFANNPSTAQALIHALEYSAFGFSRLTGIHPTYLKEDSVIVEEYKKKQQKVISTVSTGSFNRRSSSVLHAPPRKENSPSLNQSIAKLTALSIDEETENEVLLASPPPENRRHAFAETHHTMMSKYALWKKEHQEEDMEEKEDYSEDFLPRD